MVGGQKLKYHCVAVIAGVRGCAAAKALKDQRMLSADAPRLPLATCEWPAECRCTFRKFDDRRVGPRRAGERGMLASPWVNTERRRKGTVGRRESDFD
jgi:hypothetical protein